MKLGSFVSAALCAGEWVLFGNRSEAGQDLAQRRATVLCRHIFSTPVRKLDRCHLLLHLSLSLPPPIPTNFSLSFRQHLNLARSRGANISPNVTYTIFRTISHTHSSSSHEHTGTRAGQLPARSMLALAKQYKTIKVCTCNYLSLFYID